MFKSLFPKSLNPQFMEYIKILLPSFITYLVTRYSLNRPRKNEIREKQFNLVYLPLYRITKQLLTPGKYRKNISLYIRKVDKIIYQNYQFVFPKTLKLFNRLKEEFQKENPNLYHLSNFEYQIDSDYEKLKRELGYPTDSFIDFFKRLNFLDKVIYATTFLFSIVGIYAFTNCVLLFLKNDIANAISALSVSFILFIGAYLTSYPGRH